MNIIYLMTSLEYMIPSTLEEALPLLILVATAGFWVLAYYTGRKIEEKRAQDWKDACEYLSLDNSSGERDLQGRWQNIPLSIRERERSADRINDRFGVSRRKNVPVMLVVEAELAEAWRTVQIFSRDAYYAPDGVGNLIGSEDFDEDFHLSGSVPHSIKTALRSPEVYETLEKLSDFSDDMIIQDGRIKSEKDKNIFTAEELVKCAELVVEVALAMNAALVDDVGEEEMDETSIEEMEQREGEEVETEYGAEMW